HGFRLGSTVGLQSNNRPIGKPVRERMTALGRFLVLMTLSAAAVGQSPPDLQQLAGAIVQNDLSAARLIIDRAAGLDKKILGATPLHLAAEYGRTDIAKMLLDKGVSVDSIDSIGRTPLLWAAENQHVDVARLLLSHGANPNQADPSRFRGPMDNTPPDTP